MKSLEYLLQKGEELRSREQLNEACTLLEDHLHEYPHSAELYTLLGQICEQNGNHKTAIRHLENALKLNPHLLDALFTLGVAHQRSSNHLQAIELFDRVIHAVPSLPQTYYYRGLALQELGRDPEAKIAFEQALILNPEYSDAMGNLAAILFKNYHFDAAETLLTRALELNPELNHVRNNLARLYQLEGKAEESFALFTEVFQRENDNRMALSNLLYSLCYLDSMSPEEISNQHIALCNAFFNNLQASCLPSENYPVFNRHRPRIGYISNDFCLHSVSFFLEPVLIHHDRSTFEIFCYSNRPSDDETTLRIRSLDIIWRNIASLTAEDAADLIKNDHIEILVDLSGHTGKNRMDVCALKPSPIMATWIGYPHSTGMKQFDYYISDAVCAPPGMTDHLFVEKVLRLPRVFSCYLPPLQFPPVSEAPYNKNGYITFGSFNNQAKINDTTIRLWSEVLKHTPESRLLIKSASLGGKTARRHITGQFAHHGITEERLILKVHAPTPLEHLKMYAKMDIALDTYPYNGTTTTCEALWMGVPVITLAGRTHHARVSASFLTTIGCSELVANSSDEFVEIARSLAFSPYRLNNYHATLRAAMAVSPLMDGAGLTKEVEEEYTRMLENYCSSHTRKSA